ncbi:MAG: Fe-S cluster assembly protein SufD [Balneolaceae bacterium]
METVAETSILHKLADEKLESIPGILKSIRKDAFRTLQIVRFPTRKDEDWRFTDLKPITRTDFTHPEEAGIEPAGDLSEYFIPESSESRIVFINGEFSRENSSIDSIPEGVTIQNLYENLEDKTVGKYLNTLADYPEDVFVPFNSLHFTDGAFIHIGEDVDAGAPIQILNVYTNSDKPFVATPRVLVIAERGANATIVEDHIGLAGNTYMTIPVGEFKLKEGSHLHHIRLVRDSVNAVHVSRPISYLEKHAEYHSYTITLGAGLSRNEPKVIMEDEEVKFTVDGLVLIDGNQIADTHSTLDHRFSHAESHQLHKVVVNGSAHSIFNGKIFVQRNAQKIDSFQENRNLLLSIDGKVNTKPQLEIFADDVLCSHGATIGQLDPEEVFYLQSRGMTEQKAKEVLTYAFALETIENIEVESVHRLLIDEVKKYTEANNVSKVTA